MCSSCRLAPGQEGYDQHHWSGRNGVKHPVLEAEKRTATAARNLERHQKRLSRDKGKRALIRKAVKAEKKTETQQIIHSTVNSGRKFKDGDHLSAGAITLDTKLQTTRVNPVVHLFELEKVREDAKRAGTMLGALVLRNQNGVGVVVMHEQDYAKLAQRIGHTGDDTPGLRTDPRDSEALPTTVPGEPGSQG